MMSSEQPPNIAGIGLRLPHIEEVVATRPPAGWLEIHPENFMANPHAFELLTEVSRHYSISVHTVGISVGSAGGLDRTHLNRLRNLVDSIAPVFVSGHLAWSTYGEEYLNDLLPLPFNKEALRIVEEHIHEVQEALGRLFLIENPASYLGFKTSTMTEAEFLSELAVRTGCRLLCDVSNAYVSASNMGYDPYEYIDSLPAGAIREFHLGGYTPEQDEANPAAELLIDTHADAIAGPVWGLYVHAIRRIGLKPVLIEWDNDIPPLTALLEEAARADTIAGHALPMEARCARAR